LTTGAETACLEGHSDAVRALCVPPDGRFASGAYDHTIRLWELTTGAEKGRLEGHSNGVRALCALPDGRLASGSYDRTIRLWDLTIRAKRDRFKEHSEAVRALCTLPDGRLASKVARDELLLELDPRNFEAALEMANALSCLGRCSSFACRSVGGGSIRISRSRSSGWMARPSHHHVIDQRVDRQGTPALELR
jgi:putative hemolysin